MKKQIYTAEVLENTEIAPGIRRIGILYPEAAVHVRPGQFFNIYPDADRLILPRPFGVHSSSPGEGTISFIYEIVGEGTRDLAALKKGAKIRISEPLGNGFDLSGTVPGNRSKAVQTVSAAEKGTSKAENMSIHAVLVGGGVGTSVLLFLAEELTAAGAEVTAVLGFRQHPFAVEEMKKTGARVLVATDLPHDSAFQGNVCECMDDSGVTGDQYFACGPRPMLKALDEYVRAHGDDRTLQVSLDSRMACGYGVCLGCSTPVRSSDENGREIIIRKRVCKDGPVFRGNEVIW